MLELNPNKHDHSQSPDYVEDGDGWRHYFKHRRDDPPFCLCGQEVGNCAEDCEECWN